MMDKVAVTIPARTIKESISKIGLVIGCPIQVHLRQLFGFNSVTVSWNMAKLGPKDTDIQYHIPNEAHIELLKQRNEQLQLPEWRQKFYKFKPISFTLIREVPWPTVVNTGAITMGSQEPSQQADGG